MENSILCIGGFLVKNNSNNNTKMKNTLASFLLLIILLGFGLQSCEKNTKADEIVAKKGIIIPKIDSLKFSEKYCCILAPEQGFSVYDNPKGKIIGKLKKIGKTAENNQTNNEIYLIINGKKIRVDNFREIGYEIYALNYTDSSEGFVKVLDTLKSYWISIEEIEKNGFRAINWRDQMITEGENTLGYFANEPGLRLRKEPNSESEIIGSVRGDLFEIKLTKTISGQWCKVKVKKYKEHPCNTDLEEAENIESKTEGWLKIIDDNGEPNLWSYTRGC